MNRCTMLLPLMMACADKAEDSAHGEDPEAHACEHRAEAGTAITAGDSPETAATIAVTDEPYTVTVPSGAAGYLQVESAEDQAALLFLEADGVVTGISYNGEAQTLPDAAPNEDCPEEIPAHYDLDLEPGTWTFQLGPIAAASVWMNLVDAGSHSHEE